MTCLQHNWVPVWYIVSVLRSWTWAKTRTGESHIQVHLQPPKFIGHFGLMPFCLSPQHISQSCCFRGVNWSEKALHPLEPMSRCDILRKHPKSFHKTAAMENMASHKMPLTKTNCWSQSFHPPNSVKCFLFYLLTLVFFSWQAGNLPNKALDCRYLPFWFPSAKFPDSHIRSLTLGVP